MTATTARVASLGGRPYLGPSPRAAMTLQTLNKLVGNGFGDGRRELYHSWIRVRRAISSPIGNQQIFGIPGVKRKLHLLSELEKQAAALGSYLGACEAREQFPCFAHPCFHPGYDPEFEMSTPGSDDRLPTLLEIAEECRIDPGRYPGTDIPFVLTTDLVLTVKVGSAFKLVFWPVKPHGQLEGHSGRRRRERLELERRRAAYANGHFEPITDKTLSRMFVYNLLGHKPYRKSFTEWSNTEALLRFAETFNECRGAKLREAIAIAGASAAIDPRDLGVAFNVALWRGLLDVHLSKPLERHLAVPWGGLEQRRKLRRALLGIDE